MRKQILVLILGVFSTLSYGQCPTPPPAPTVDSQQSFCSATAWMLIGANADYLSDLQVFPDQVGWTLNWYADNGGTQGASIASPTTELLVSGTVYYLTQTDAAGCESPAVAITVSEKDCGCIKDPGFEDQNGNESARGYSFVQFPNINNHKTCGQSMQGANAINIGPTPNVMTGDVVYTTPGNDPNATIPLARTNPDNLSSNHAIRLNSNTSGAKITAMNKEFIAGQVFVFNFALVLENPAGHSFEEQPFAQIRLYDQNNNVVQQRCLVSDPNDCIFIPAGSSSTLYSEWSCIKLNTFDYSGEPLRAEFIVSWCELTAHYGYLYVDDLYAGDDDASICGDSSFGYALIEDISPAGENCFIPEPSTDIQGCGSGVTASIPGFPLQVCGSYDAPISQGPPPSLEDITLNIIQNDNIVGTVTNPAQGNGPNTFCFTLNEIDINVLPYGDFTFDLEIDFELDCGVPYNFFIDDMSSVNLCPTAGCPQPLTFCDTSGTGLTTFDLTDAEIDIYGNNWQQGDIILSYYEDEEDAHDAVNPIADPTTFQNTIPFGQTVYVRLDWAIPQLTTDCYYLAELDLFVNRLPNLDQLPDEFTVCDADFSVTLSGTPSNLPDLQDISYQWFRDGNQLPTTASFYDATIPGEYTVIVSNFDCEVTHTFTIELIEFDVDLGDDITVCDEANIVLNADIIEGPDTDPIDINDVTFAWSTGETTQSITVTQSGTYTVDVTYEDCTQSQTINVSVNDVTVNIGEDVVLCDISDGYQLTANVSGAPTNQTSYLWSTGETTQTITVFDFGTYTVDVNFNGCTASDSINITQAAAPLITLGDDVTKCTGDEITLSVQFIEPIDGDITYSWFLDGGQLMETGQSIQVTEFGIYTVNVNNQGCVAEASITVNRFENNADCLISQGISPDGSPGQNDNLDLSFLASRTGIEKLEIFNRNGRLVYEFQNYTNQWVGQTTDGEELPTGVYFYVINLSGNDPVFGTNTNGWIYINRAVN
ncbi:T9SS type B sorting domain-containing protein [Aequorivita echinoideorum]|uniref:T9SS type A sorting domain-containing protein n=1 Tax=Aequorivita echinoideorum TaxID=1549647 RepID=A0ABS5S255_9FLAO|nr:gliding motility-associated C-terminal domain-containing protein [Aequorivita echinoideorum]MBT0607271.1 T9SS type A sorting domain-containing protein [Aequorivita echinoideorum]